MVFEYSPIDRDNGQHFRLLTVYPGQKGSPIVCSLTHYGLGDLSRHKEGLYQWSTGTPFYHPDQPPAVPWVPEYEALSYTWGDQSVLRPIQVNNREFNVTQNLYSALHRFRKSDEKRALWTDAVCINQADNDEKSQQIELMVTIFVRAKEVLVWLGDSDDGGDLAMHLIDQMGGSKEQLAAFDFAASDWDGPLRDPFYGIGDSVNEYHKAYRQFLGSLGLMDRAAVDEAGLSALDKLFNQRSWWKRVWVIQEVTFPQNVTLYCGARSVPWESLENVIHNRLNQTNTELSRIIQKSGVATLSAQRAYNREWTRLFGFEMTPLLEVLQSFRNFQSTDPRDKVFALLGLASSSKEMALPRPDYKKSVSIIYSETTRAIIKHQRNLAVLCLGHFSCQPQPSQHDIPSWAPDWTVVPDVAPLYSSLYQASRDHPVEGPDIPLQPDNPSDETEKTSPRGDETNLLREPGKDKVQAPLPATVIYHPAPATSGPDQKILSTNGILWDTISSVTRPMPNDALDSGEWKYIIRDWEPDGLESDPESYPGLRDQKPLKAFWITLMRNQMFMPENKSPEAWDEAHQNYHEQYLVWMGRILAKDIKHSLFLKWLEQFPLESIIDAFSQQIQEKLRGWKFCVTKKGYMGMVPNHAEPGDLVCVFFGSKVPLLIRPTRRDDSCFTVVGSLYMHGIMSGEVIDELEKGNIEKRTFDLE
ncbi:HET-domain-containing protein [Cenococcum geophilum 1.58]|uniref:HET-domain-containing protein n=1 Tax=Cenococcum geophilum 1.58 TaxID=794803 RepID=UPI00358E7887|nr:HET-domain-containing protein [Cenococcum geophilum 1.58]